MRKLTVALVVGALVAMLAAPAPAAAGVQFGIKGGGNMAKLTGSDLQDINGTLKNKVGFVAGVFLAFNMGPVFTLQLEGLYTMKGVDQTYIDTGTTYTDKLSANYIEIPLLFKFRIPTPLVSPFVFAGPAVSFKLSEKVTENGQTVPLDQALFKNNDYGAIFGGGINIGSHFQMDVRYSMGMSKVISTVEGETPLNIKNGVWSATVGIAF
ncbi:MAG TPA: porin family protein [Terriglobales bacterium]|nr:porin family protein [Terriglobales bacterium]